MPHRHITAEIRGESEPDEWLGAIFLLALATIAFALFEDITLTRCARGSFLAVVGWCSSEYR
jgi:hypothetical protein